MNPPVRHVSTHKLRFLVLDNRLDWPVVQILVDGREASPTNCPVGRGSTQPTYSAIDLSYSRKNAGGGSPSTAACAASKGAASSHPSSCPHPTHGECRGWTSAT